ncbi:MAG: penicillin-binding protein 2 [Gemmatimonadetes bacterium]|nr:penicillin-binding protein 2 [Gemmatimonadota bacterium]
MNWNHPHILARRAQLASVMVGGLFVVLVGAFFRLQVVGADQYQIQSRNNSRRPVVLRAPRGIIVDRHGAVIATNVPSYTISLIAATRSAFEATLDSMLVYGTLDSLRREEVLGRYERSPDNSAVIMRDAPFAMVAALEERKSSFPGLIVQTEPKRHYPHRDIISHLLGYVGEVSEEELAASRFVRARLGGLVGRGGLEEQYDSRLRGFDGRRLVVVDALGRTIGDDGGERLEPEQGDTIRTALDLDLQQYVADVFPAGQRGAVMAMDPRNGDILAMYSSPSFDPNAFIGGIDRDLWEEWRTAEDTPLLNRAVQGIYPPASPWKLVLALLALEKRGLTLDTKMPVQCSGGYQYFTRYFRCWKSTGHGELTLLEAIQHSCDVYFYQLGLHLGLDVLFEGPAALGLTSRTGVDLPNEVVPTYPPGRSYFDDLYGPRGWTTAVTLNLAIGQGENAQTLINMMQFYAMLARNDGAAPVPRLVLDRGEPVLVPGLASPENILGLREALEMVVERGTALRSRLANLRIAGKTGTAQNSGGPNHGWFIGFGPVEDPQVVVGAIVEFGEHGSVVAPMVTRIIERHLLGPDAAADRPVRWILPSDSAPVPIEIEPRRRRTGQTR